MKCVKKDKDIRRVNDNRAAKLVSDGYTYCPKHTWKETLEKAYEEDVVLASKNVNKNKKSKGKKSANAEAKKAVKETEMADAVPVPVGS